MSLVTKCPSCYTSFIVRPEQLTAHEGKVRCGQCQHVFIANDHLIESSTTVSLAGSKSIQKRSWARYALLIILALLQLVFFTRGEIASTWPAFKPALSSTCHLLGCHLPLPQHAELIAIDDTELVKDESHEGVVKFNCQIINNAPYAQSYPAIELALTDSQDIAIVRRKITPKDYLSGSKAKPEDGIAAGDEIHVTLNIKTADLPVSGFRAFVVY